MDLLSKTNAVIGIISGLLGAVAILLTWYVKYKRKVVIKEKFEVSTLATRFIALFESHGVHRNQIPEFFDHGLEIPSCTSDEELLKKLTPEIIADAVKLFGVNKDWLEGSSSEIYDIPDFYKHPEKFESYLFELLKNTDANKLSAYALTSNKKSTNGFNDSLFVITESIGKINQREIYKYHLLGNWGIHYWKSRAYFTACCALMFKHGLLVTGDVVDRDWLSDICEGHKLLDYDFTERYGGVDFPAVGSWIVSDFVEMPNEYLKGMNTEQGHATGLALDMWLSLSEKGYMRCFPEDEVLHVGVENEFKQKIKKSV